MCDLKDVKVGTILTRASRQCIRCFKTFRAEVHHVGSTLAHCNCVHCDREMVMSLMLVHHYQIEQPKSSELVDRDSVEADQSIPTVAPPPVPHFVPLILATLENVRDPYKSNRTQLGMQDNTLLQNEIARAKRLLREIPCCPEHGHGVVEIQHEIRWPRADILLVCTECEKGTES